MVVPEPFCGSLGWARAARQVSREAVFHMAAAELIAVFNGWGVGMKIMIRTRASSWFPLAEGFGAAHLMLGLDC